MTSIFYNDYNDYNHYNDYNANDYKNAKMGVFGYLGGTENGTSGARIKILRPLYNTNTPPKTPI